MQSQWISFRDKGPARDALLKWWNGLETDRASRAELRRCRSPRDVLFCPAYHRLLHALLQTGQKVNREKLALVAGIAARVKAAGDNYGSLAVQMATPKPGRDVPPVKGLRFRRLLQCRSEEEAFTSFSRVLHLLDQTTDLATLANDLYWWNDRTRKQYAFDYYGRAPKED